MGRELAHLLRYQRFGGSDADKEAALDWLGRRGVMAGPDRVFVVPGAHAALLAALCVVGIAGARTSVRIGALAAAALGAIVAGALFAQHVLLVTYPMPTALAMILMAAGCCLGRDVLHRFRTQRTVDEATGLPNARALLGTRGAATATTVAVAQIGGFDGLHAVLGTATADLVARVAERLALTSADGAVYRIADRQLAFLLDVDVPADEALDGLRAVMLRPIEVTGRRVDVALAIGVAGGPGGITDARIVDATLAADEAARQGVFWRHAATDLGSLERSVSLMGERDEAIAGDQLEGHYQPKYDLGRERITSAEALVRWRHPVRGFIGPDLFVPLAERTNRIGPLTLYVVEQVMRDVAAWRARYRDVTAAINISATLLTDAGFNAAVERLLEATGVPAAALVTASAAMSDPAAAVAALHHYRELGIAVSMDDYGTGQSTLTYLRQLPLNELKIDRSFVQHAHRNRNDALLVRSTIDLAHQMGLKVVAEGVEDEDCMAFLRRCECDMVQGYLISKPVPLDGLHALLDADRLPLPASTATVRAAAAS